MTEQTTETFADELSDEALDQSGRTFNSYVSCIRLEDVQPTTV